MKNFRIASCTDVGVARQNNEDSMITFDCPNGRVVVVCDGMGGENGGEIASDLAVTIIQDIMKNYEFNDTKEAIVRSMVAANQGLLHRSAQNPSLQGMGCTCVMLVIKNNKCYYGSVGDSRIYYYAPNKGLQQITKDQSYVQTLVDAGEITAEAAEQHPRKNEITNALGISEMVPPVVPSPITPDDGGTFLLCSDGLTGMVDYSMIQQVLSSGEMGTDQKAKKLVDLANEAGGLDNITVQLVEFGNNGEKVANEAKFTQPASSNVADSACNSVEKEQKKGNRFIIISTIAVLLVFGGVFAWYFMNEKKNNDTPKRQITITIGEKNGGKVAPTNKISTSKKMFQTSDIKNKEENKKITSSTKKSSSDDIMSRFKKGQKENASGNAPKSKTDDNKGNKADNKKKQEIIIDKGIDTNKD